MDLVTHYANLYNESLKRINSNNYQLDSLIDSNLDNRRGMTLLIRPNEKVKNNIQQFLDELKAIEPNQYYYPNSDIHLTVMSIVSCYDGFSHSKVSISEYIDEVKKSTQGVKEFSIEFRGITLSPACVLIQGFLQNNVLNDIRNRLRTNFKSSGLMQTIDKRYSIQTAHSTVVRFRKKFTNKEAYLNLFEKYRDYPFGKFTVKNFELVFNDWYQRKDKVEKLYSFHLES